MPSPDELLAEQTQQKRAALVASDEEKRQQARARDAQMSARLHRLLGDQEVLWFLGEFVEPIMEREHGEALDLNRSGEERDRSAHRYALARELRGLLAKKEAEYRGRAEAGHEG